jgi:uncharacterized protein YbcI
MVPEQTFPRSPALEISNMAVQVMREYTGRGPTQARTTINHQIVVILMRDTLLKAEKSLVAAGEANAVLDTRHKFQKTMEDELVGGVERITGRKVVAFMSDNHIDPDLAAEVFVMGDGQDAAQTEPASEHEHPSHAH